MSYNITPLHPVLLTCIRGVAILVSFAVLYASIAEVSTHQVDVGVALRSSAGGVGVVMSVTSFGMTGHAATAAGLPPDIITTKNITSGIIYGWTAVYWRGVTGWH